ncbi:Os12g0564866 [Oryza sativa Japonica Group]|uniref:Os12g0564866 protein n=1 Tax=Oryza sativa subsp. japonica TaxID=39947 RepID=A0A0P0YBL2_ORYSJ|nr:hypothetical protein EE612_060310 [Oryza sativa]BAT17680.1 Os12g0564866 [Oryza sativa Japonica Group]
MSQFESLMLQFSPRILSFFRFPSSCREYTDVLWLISISDNSCRACRFPIPSGNSKLFTLRHTNFCSRTILDGNFFICVHLKSKVCKFCNSPSCSGSAVILLTLSRRYFN